MPSLESQTVQLLDAMGTWFSGLVTLFAILISYLLATRSQRIITKKSIQISFLSNNISDQNKLIHIRITNLNTIPLNLTGLTWTIKTRKSAPGIFCMYFHQPQYSLPVLLDPGKESNIMINMSDFVDAARNFWIQNAKVPSRRMKSLTAVVSTSTGKTIQLNAPKELITQITSPATKA